jgi:hypothetical protein
MESLKSSVPNDSCEGSSKLYKKRVFSVVFLSFIVCLPVFCQIAYSDDVLTVGDLPSAGESLVISSDNRVTILEGETVVIDGNLQVNGSVDGGVITFTIANYGDLTIKNTEIRCNYANLSIENKGTLTLQITHFTVIGNSTLNISNMVESSMTDLSIDVFGGYAYIQNVGSLTINNGYFKDQNDGTFILNYGDATLSECTFVANGAQGKIELFSSGDLELNNGNFDINYGGKVNINTLTGTIAVDELDVDVSGASHGQRSAINVLTANSTWNKCNLINNDGTINYLITGELNSNEFSVSQLGTDATTILSGNGPIVFENFQFSGSGLMSLTNWESMKLVDSSFESSDSLTVMNNGELTAENWIVKTTSSNALVTVFVSEDSNLSFDESFIENVSRDTLVSVGSDGQEFVESSGGIITVTNNGVLTQQGSRGSSLEFFLYVLIIVAAVAVALYVILKNRKKSCNVDVC